MIELRDRPRLLAEQGAHRYLAYPLAREQELEGDLALQLLVPGPEDQAHRAGTELVEDLEALAIQTAHPLAPNGHTQRDGDLGHLAQKGVIEVRVIGLEPRVLGPARLLVWVLLTSTHLPALRASP